MKWYVSSPDEAVFSSVALPEEPLTTQSEETAPKNAQPAYADSPAGEAAVKTLKGNQLEESSPQINFLGRRRCYTPPGQSLLPDRSLPSLKAPSGGLIVGVLRRGWFNASRQMRS